MKHLNNTPYSKQIEKHFKVFIEDYDLVQGRELVVGVSGGVDSMVLLTLLSRSGYCCESVYINHGTRLSQKKDEDLVKEFTKKLRIKNSVFRLKTLQKTNFENTARIERYKVFHFMAQDYKLICLGHHIDDSFEWSLMQSLKSSNLRSSLGIPLINGNIIRPLMCLTKKQILKYANEVGVPFREDPTNKDNTFERNYIRNEVIPKMKVKHPQLLKHYVNRSNELARVLKLHSINTISKYKMTINLNESGDRKEKSALIYCMERSLTFSGIESQILKAMNIINPNSRGVLSEQIKRIIQAMKNHKFGPLILTNGIKAYVSFNAVLLTKLNDGELTFSKYKDIDVNTFELLLQKKLSDHGNFPFFVLLDSNNKLKIKSFSKNKNIYPYNASYSSKLIKDLTCHQYALKLLSQWKKPKNRNKRLDLTF